MGYQFKDDFEGAGSMTDFVADSNVIFKALNNINVIMPPNYSGSPCTFEVDKDGVVFDMASALIFSLGNVRWDLSGENVEFDSFSAKVESGQLVITVVAHGVCP